jgi:hypothetical protein
MEERRKDFGDAHGTHDIGVEAGVHAFPATLACVGDGCVVDYDVDVAMGMLGILACADDGAVFGDIDLD